MGSTKVTNNPFSTLNADIDVLTDENTSGYKIQVVRLDVGSGTAESRVAGSLPVSSVAGSSNLSNSSSSALESGRQIKASPGTLFLLSGFNNHTSDQFIQLFDSASTPANGSIPKIVILAPAGMPFGYAAPNAGRLFSVGIYVCNSTTGATKTIGSANCLFDAQYL